MPHKVCKQAEAAAQTDHNLPCSRRGCRVWLDRHLRGVEKRCVSDALHAQSLHALQIDGCFRYKLSCMQATRLVAVTATHALLPPLFLLPYIITPLLSPPPFNHSVVLRCRWFAVCVLCSVDLTGLRFWFAVGG